jgi:hypothetical protein
MPQLLKIEGMLAIVISGLFLPLSALVVGEQLVSFLQDRALNAWFKQGNHRHTTKFQ